MTNSAKAIPFTQATCPQHFIVLEKKTRDMRGLMAIAHRLTLSRDDAGNFLPGIGVNIYYPAIDTSRRDGNETETVTFGDLLERFEMVEPNGNLSPAGIPCESGN
jgi:hypothetical protein